MATNKFFKSLLFALMIAINLFSVCIEDSSAYPVFAQQNYSNPRAANGKLACANCHLNQKAIELDPDLIEPRIRLARFYLAQASALRARDDEEGAANAMGLVENKVLEGLVEKFAGEVGALQGHARRIDLQQRRRGVAELLLLEVDEFAVLDRVHGAVVLGSGEVLQAEPFRRTGPAPARRRERRAHHDRGPCPQ